MVKAFPDGLPVTLDEVVLKKEKNNR